MLLKKKTFKGTKASKLNLLKRSLREEMPKKKNQVHNGLNKLLIPVWLASKQFVHLSKGIRRKETYLTEFQENVQEITIKNFFPVDTL